MFLHTDGRNFYGESIMAPGFFSKLVKPSGHHSRNSSTQSSPHSPTPSRNPSISVSSAGSPKSSVEHANGKTASASPRNAQLKAAPSFDSLDSGPNVTVVPPSPRSVSGNSISVSNPPSPAHPPRELAPERGPGGAESARKRIQSLPAASNPSSEGKMPSSPSLSDDGLATPTPSTTTFTSKPPAPSSSPPDPAHARPAEDMRDDSLLGARPATRANHPRAATVAEGGGLQAPKQLRHSSSNRSLRSKLSIMLPSRDSPPVPAPPPRAPSAPSPPLPAEETALVESPTGIALSHEIPPIASALPPASAGSSFGQNLHVPDNSDAASLYSVSSATSKKRRPWRRPSNPGPPPVPRSATGSSTGRSPPRKNSAAAPGGLASALAASGLAMAHPAVTLPPSFAPAETSAHGRTSFERRAPRSRGASLTNGAGDFSDRDSFRSASDSEASDDSDDLDLDPEDIPVTGFAVASNKRNQDFHELFPTVPEGDYLIEGAYAPPMHSLLCTPFGSAGSAPRRLWVPWMGHLEGRGLWGYSPSLSAHPLTRPRKGLRRLLGRFCAQRGGRCVLLQGAECDGAWIIERPGTVVPDTLRGNASRAMRRVWK